jgi:hypothetical protein
VGAQHHVLVGQVGARDVAERIVRLEVGVVESILACRPPAGPGTPRSRLRQIWPYCSAETASSGSGAPARLPAGGHDAVHPEDAIGAVRGGQDQRRLLAAQQVLQRVREVLGRRIRRSDRAVAMRLGDRRLGAGGGAPEGARGELRLRVAAAAAAPNSGPTRGGSSTSTIAPPSRPRYRSSSSCVCARTISASAVTAPGVLPVQARGCACSGCTNGVRTRPLYETRSQPRPNCPQGTTPHVLEAPASQLLGRPVVGPPHPRRPGEPRADDVGQVAAQLRDLRAVQPLVADPLDDGGVDRLAGGLRRSAEGGGGEQRQRQRGGTEGCLHVAAMAGVRDRPGAGRAAATLHDTTAGSGGKPARAPGSQRPRWNFHALGRTRRRCRETSRTTSGWRRSRWD